MEMVKIIAEIGINANGDLGIAKKLIDMAAFYGCYAVKFQKRTINTVHSKQFLDSPRESPWGKTQREQKEHLEFGKTEYDEIDRYCKERKMPWSASAWDLESLEFLEEYDLPFNKIASPMLTHVPLLCGVARQKKHTFVSAGMSTLEDIRTAVDIFRTAGCSFELMHCVSVYNMPVRLANLRAIESLGNIFNCDCGYSGHEQTIILACAAVAMGATSIEKHITLDHAMYGSDQAASLEPHGVELMVKYIRAIEQAMGDGEKKIAPEEQENIAKLRYFEEVEHAARR